MVDPLTALPSRGGRRRARCPRTSSQAVATLALLAALVAAPGCADPAQSPAPAATSTMAHQHAHDAPTPSPAVGRTGGTMQVVTRTVQYALIDGAPVRGALARPAGAGKGGPAVLLVHEWWGLNDNIRDIARQLASQGYTALAVDLYGGRSATDPGKAEELMKRVLEHPETARENLRQAVRYLRQDVGAAKVGVIGWCFGGGWALEAALVAPEGVDAVVVYYGEPELDRARLALLRAPLLGLYGDRDDAFPPKTVRKFEALLKELGKPATIRTFPGAGHAFANPSGGRYVKAAADEAWKLTEMFLDEHLRGG
jgi:carboxymethylenebutenolidase